MKCVVCNSRKRIGLFGDDEMPVCEPCYDGGRFKKWLASQMELALSTMIRVDDVTLLQDLRRQRKANLN